MNQDEQRLMWITHSIAKTHNELEKKELVKQRNLLLKKMNIN